MAELREALSAAVDKGILSKIQFMELSAFLADRGFDGLSEEGANAGAQSAAHAAATELTDSEMPRFVRGFHDILITIGVIAALGGLGGLAGPYFSLPAIVILAEILVRRQMLALPAFVLSIAFGANAAVLVAPFVGDFIPDNDPALAGAVVSGAQALLLVPFYWRYRVPVALALMIASGLFTAFMLTLAAIQAVGGFGNLLETELALVRILSVVFALGLFAIAMRYDVQDVARLTRRSDIAFWLHLVAAPALLFAAFSLLLFDSQEVFWWEGDPGLTDALAAMAIILVMMLIGIVIDRRAFVTSGLISLGVALFILGREAEIDMTGLTALPVFMVGLVVLTLGIGWLRLREFVVAAMPEFLTRHLPPIAAPADPVRR